MIVFRICKTYPPNHDPMDGVGAFKRGGRWNSKGTYAVYTSSSIALARAELARHINLESIPDGFRIYEIELPDKTYTEINPLPADWNNDPENPDSQQIGDQYLQNTETLAIKVPSVCDHDSFNFILNPLYKNYKQVRIIKDYPFIP